MLEDADSHAKSPAVTSCHGHVMSFWRCELNIRGLPAFILALCFEGDPLTGLNNANTHTAATHKPKILLILASHESWETKLELTNNLYTITRS